MPNQLTLKRFRIVSKQLSLCHIRTIRDLKQRVGRDIENGVQLVAQDSAVPTEILLSFLLAEMLLWNGEQDHRGLVGAWRRLISLKSVIEEVSIDTSPPPRPKGFRAVWEVRNPVSDMLRQLPVWSLNVLDKRKQLLFNSLLFVVVPAVVILLIVRVVQTNRRLVPYATARTSISAFQKIEDVDMKISASKKGVFTNAEDVRGSYTLTAISEGQPITKSQILKSDLSSKMAGRVLVTLQVKSGSFSPALQPPVEAILILSPRERGASSELTSFDVILLSIDTQGDVKSATVAVTSSDFKSAAPLVGSSDALLSQAIK